MMSQYIPSDIQPLLKYLEQERQSGNVEGEFKILGLIADDFYKIADYEKAEQYEQEYLLLA